MNGFGYIGQTNVMVNFTLYRCSLVAALSLMVFFGLTFVFGRKHFHTDAYLRYCEARLRLGLALLVLAANYAVHLFIAPRFNHPEWAIMMNIDTYYIAAWLFGSSMHHLLSRDYNSTRRDFRNVVSWMAFVIVMGTMLYVAPGKTWSNVTLIVASGVFMLYTLRVALRLLAAYHRAVRLLDSYHSDNVAAYVRWMSVFTYLAIFYGIGQGVFTFVPDRYVFVWILSSIPFYTYGYLAYINYFFAIDKVNEVLVADTEAEQEQEAKAEELIRTESEQATQGGINSLVGSRLKEWMEQNEFTRQGVTIAQVAQDIGTNRTYVSAYINNHYHMSFREWINSLRIEYVKTLLTTQPNLTIAEVALRAGYVSQSNFSRLFTTMVGMTPSQWRKEKVMC